MGDICMHGCKHTYLHAYVHGHRCSQHTHIQTKKNTYACRHTHKQTNIHRIRRHVHTQMHECTFAYTCTSTHVYLSRAHFLTWLKRDSTLLLWKPFLFTQSRLMSLPFWLPFFACVRDSVEAEEAVRVRALRRMPFFTVLGWLHHSWCGPKKPNQLSMWPSSHQRPPSFQAMHGIWQNVWVHQCPLVCSQLL